MGIPRSECCVLNAGPGAWAFEPLANQLATALNIDVSTEPRRFNYVLHLEESQLPPHLPSFIPSEAIQLAADKRLLAAVFRDRGVPTPETHLFDSFEQVVRFVRSRSEREWCLKYPTSCGATGHRLIEATTPEPPNWPRPFIVQEFFRLAPPEVFRTYCAGGEGFGWVVRRFPDGARQSPWVAHAQGALYQPAGNLPGGARTAARLALQATGLWDSFGCADLLRRPSGEWVVLEVGTDGLYNHVDRELADPKLESELRQQINRAFWTAAASRDERKQTNRPPIA